MLNSVLKSFMPQANAQASPKQADFSISISEKDGQIRTLDLSAGEYTLGSAASADLIIPDASDEEVLLLRLEQRKEGASIIIVPLADNIFARDRTLPKGVPVLFGDRAKITYEEIIITINAGGAIFSATKNSAQFNFFKSKSAASVQNNTQKSNRLKSSLSLICMGVGLALLSFSGIGQFQFHGTSREAQHTTSAGNEPTKIILDDMGKKIAASGLGKNLSLKVEDNHILVAGHLPLENSKALKDIIASVSARYGIDVVTNLKLDSQTPLFAAVAIYPKTYVITNDNKKSEVGSTLKDGSLIENITDNSLLINHDGLEFSIDF